MKKTVKLLVFAALLSFFAVNTNAQKTVKLGHFNSRDLIQKMPDYAKAQDTLNQEMEKLRAELAEMQQEVERLSNDFEAKKNQLSDLLKQTKEKEIKDAYSRYQNHQANGQQLLSNREAELTANIYQKVKTAAENVAKANKYDYVFESNGVLWYASDSDDITALIEKELGLK